MTGPNGIVAVMRGRDAVRVEEACRALHAGGVAWIEITFTVPDATRVIERLSGLDMMCGAGTVTDAEQARIALESGARFLVTPACLPEVASFAQSRSIPCLVGAMTPTEILGAWRAGAVQVKVFPVARLGGPHYLSDLAGPFPQIRFAPSGGIKLEEVRDYALPNVDSIGLGGSLAPADAIATGDTAELERRAHMAAEAFASRGGGGR